MLPLFDNPPTVLYRFINDNYGYRLIKSVSQVWKFCICTRIPLLLLGGYGASNVYSGTINVVMGLRTFCSVYLYPGMILVVIELRVIVASFMEL